MNNVVKDEGTAGKGALDGISSNDNDGRAEDSFVKELPQRKQKAQAAVEGVGTTEQQDSQQEEDNIGKAIRFWTNPSLRDIPPDQKRAYLNERGVTERQIQKAWERIAEGETTTTTSINPSTMPNSNNTLQTKPLLAPGTTTNRIPSHSSNYGVHAQAGPYDYSQQQQHLYPSQPLPNGMFHHPEEEDGPVSVSQGLSLVALGSVMGLAAAATVRWLNGGDFNFLPPPTFASSHKTGTVPSRAMAIPLVLEEPRTLNTEEMDGRAGDDEADEVDEAFYESEDQADDEDDDDDGEWVHQLVEKMETLTTTIQSSTGLQEKILQKLAMQTTTTITDHSMDLLRSLDKKNDAPLSSPPPIGNGGLEREDKQQLQALWSKLGEIKVEMSSLCRKDDPSATVVTVIDGSSSSKASWEQHLETTLAKLDSCLGQTEAFLGTLQAQSLNIHASAAGTPDVETSVAATTPLQRRPTDSVTASSTVTTTPQSGSSSSSSNSPVSISSHKLLSLRDIFRKIAEDPNTAARRTGCQLLYLYVVNLFGQPDNPRYRRIFTSNESFQQVENLAGAKELLFALGFVEDPKNPSYLDWKPNHQRNMEKEIDDGEEASNTIDESPLDDKVMQLLRETAAALSILKSSRQSESLVESALAVLSTERDTAISPSPPGSPVNDNSIASPPVPKKHPYIPSSDTPSFATSTKQTSTTEIEPEAQISET
jgi:hypothetical protein